MHLGTTNLGGTIVSLSGSAGDYVAGSIEGTLHLVTLGDGDLPVVESQLALSGQVVDVLESSHRAYCALGGANAVAVVDVLDRSAPSLVAVYNLLGAARSLVRTGDLLLVGVDGVGLVVFEIRDEGLVQTDTVTLAAAPTDLVVWNERLFMARPQLGLAEADPSLGTDIVPLARIYNRVSAGVVDSGFAVVKVLTTGGELLAYASVVDNGSNDPIFIPAQRLSDTSPFTY